VGYTKNFYVFLVCHENFLPRGVRSLTAPLCLCLCAALHAAVLVAPPFFCAAHVVYLP
jgi:hypothetical protein